MIGIWPRHPLADGTLTTQPEFSFYFDDVGWRVENYGTDPDVEVDNPPQDYARGVDAQLDRAIEIVLGLLTRAPAAHPAAHPGPEHGPARPYRPALARPRLGRSKMPLPRPLPRARERGTPVSEFPSPPKRGGVGGGALRGLLDVEELDLEEQRRVRRDHAAAP